MSSPSSSSASSSSSNRAVLIGAFLLGLFAIAWVGVGFVGSGSSLALGMTLAIAAVYLLGAQEIRHFHRASTGLAQALAHLTHLPQPLDSLADWLERVPAPLQHSVRQRIQSGRAALPGLALTPYLVGLLVMLGMLGTFLGMVLTFKGAVFALEGSADLGAIRGALAAPIKGLGLSFGTSVAGVAGSAMLGLMSAVARSQRTQVARQLEQHTSGALRPFSAAFAAAVLRDGTFSALQRQADALPQVVTQLQALMVQVEQRHQQLDTQLSARQDQFHREAAAAYTGLAQSVAQALQSSLSASAHAAGERIQPVVEQAMAALASESTRSHERVSQAVHTHLTGLSTEFAATALAQQQAVCQTLERTASALQHSASDQATHTTAEVDRLLTTSQAQLLASGEAHAQWAQQHSQRMDQLATLWRDELNTLRSELSALRAAEATHLHTLRTEEAARGQAAVQRLGELQGAVTQHLAALGSALQAPMAHLLETASEAPKAAAQVIAQLRSEMNRDIQRTAQRDTAALQERTELVQHLSTLLHSVQQTTGEQRAAIETLVASATSVLQQTGTQFAQTLGAQTGQAQEQAAQLATSASELAALGQAFQQGVLHFSSSNEKLVNGLQRVEGAIGHHMARSDEQLAYYVAQAREVVDLSISAQQGIVDNLRFLRSTPASASKPAASKPTVNKPAEPVGQGAA